MASGDTLDAFDPMGGYPSASNFAGCGLRNAIPVIAFDASTAQSWIFPLLLPGNYAGGGLTLLIDWMGATATSGDVKWNAAIERNNASNHDLDADNFATAQTTTTTTNATSGKIAQTSIAITSGANMDSAAAGDVIRLKLTRDAANGADTMTGDAHFLFGVVKET